MAFFRSKNLQSNMTVSWHTAGQSRLERACQRTAAVRFLRKRKMTGKHRDIVPIGEPLLVKRKRKSQKHFYFLSNFVQCLVEEKNTIIYLGLHWPSQRAKSLPFQRVFIIINFLTSFSDKWPEHLVLSHKFFFFFLGKLYLLFKSLVCFKSMPPKKKGIFKFLGF